MTRPRPAKAARAALAALLGLSGVALAAPAATAAPSFGPAHYGNGGHAYSGSGVWGGYVSQGRNFTSITGGWTMPTVHCNSRNDLFAPWIGIDGYGSQTVEQTGVEASCASGRPVYSGWYEMYPAPPVYFSNPVSAGDVFTASVTTNGRGTYALKLTDVTKGWTQSTQKSLNARNVSAEAVIESPSQSYPSFSSLNFSDIVVNGQIFDAYYPQAIDSGPYTETALQNGSFSIIPG
ncbi:G1 family endopeptidase [Kitasatospora nipponensis]|uniref:G1 family endopeptidase n=1 Tax=Kitasatospora nipponensis TaxID=258049 RepID=A0ABN1WVY9_9ACTN